MVFFWPWAASEKVICAVQKILTYLQLKIWFSSATRKSVRPLFVSKLNFIEYNLIVFEFLISTHIFRSKTFKSSTKPYKITHHFFPENIKSLPSPDGWKFINNAMYIKIAADWLRHSLSVFIPQKPVGTKCYESRHYNILSLGMRSNRHRIQHS